MPPLKKKTESKRPTRLRRLSARRAQAGHKASQRRHVESHEHKDKKRVSNLSVGLVTPDTDPHAGQKKKTYAFDPPYGIKYGSNFQPFVNKRDVKDGKDEDLTAEPEQIRAVRGTWGGWAFTPTSLTCTTDCYRRARMVERKAKSNRTTVWRSVVCRSLR